MPRKITFEGVSHNFPDDATDDEIRSVLEAKPQPVKYGPGHRIEDDPDMASPEMAIPERNFATEGGSQVAAGVRQLGQPGFDPKMGGAAKILKGSALIASPVLASMGVAGTAAAPLRALGGLIGGGSGGVIGKHGSKALGAGEGTQDLMEEFGQLIGGISGERLSNLIARGAAKAFGNVTQGVGFRNKLHEAEPGYGYLTDTKGIRPKTVQASRGKRLGELSDVKAAELAQTGLISLEPSRNIHRKALAEYTDQGAEEIVGALRPIGDALQGNRVTGAPYAKEVPAAQAMNIARGLKALSRWNSVTPPEAPGVAQRAYGATVGQIHEANPRVMALDSRSQNLMAGRDPSKVTALRAGPMENIVHRGTAHSGALTAATTHGPLALLAQTAASMPEVTGLIARGLWRGVGGERFGAPRMPQRQLSAFDPSGSVDPAIAALRNVGAEGGEFDPGRKLLPAATSGIGVSGVIVPDIIGRSSRGQGTPYRLLTAPTTGPTIPMGARGAIASLPPAQSVSGIGGGTEVPRFINKQVFQPKQIEAAPFDRGLPLGSPDPFRNPRSLPGDVIEGGSDSFPMSTRPSETVAPSTRKPNPTAKPEGTRGVPFGKNNPFIKKFRKPEKLEGEWVETDFTGSGPIASLRDDPLGLFNV